MSVSRHKKAQGKLRFLIRTMQKFINRVSPDVLDELMNLLKGKFAALLTDTYGNYFCQKLIQTATAEQRLFLLNDVKFFILDKK